MKIKSVLWLLFCSCLIASSADIDRKTFFVSLPDKWSENTKDDMYSPDSFVFFEGPESTFFFVMVGKKSAGASVDALLDEQKKAMSKRFTDATTTAITNWSSFDGKGFKMEGKAGGIVSARLTVFGLEKGDNVCVIEEYGTVGDCSKYAKDFQKLRQTFKLK